MVWNISKLKIERAVRVGGAFFVGRRSPPLAGEICGFLFARFLL